LNYFRTEPNNPFANLFIALCIGVVFGAGLFATVDAALFNAEIELGSFLVELIGLALFAFLLGAPACLLYGAPLLYLLQKLRLAGPASALFTAIAPSVFLAFFTQPYALSTACFAVSVGVAFVLLAYRKKPLH